MKYFKIIFNDEFIGVGTSLNFRKIQKKHGILLACDESEAQYIECNSMLYRAEWMVTDPNQVIGNQFAQVIEINKDEYDALYNAVESGEEIEIEISQDEEETIEPDPVEEITIEYVKDQKIKEMTSMSNKAIIDGFDMELDDGSIHRFTLTKENRLSIYSLQSILLSGQASIPYMDNDSCILLSTTEIQNLLTKANNHTIYNKLYLNSLKSYIKSLNDINAISKIEYGIEIPEEYQTDVLRQLIASKE